MTKPLPCGTPAAARRHARRGEENCEPCATAVRNQSTQNRRKKGIQPRAYNKHPLPHLIEEIQFLLNAGEGTQRILQATNYEGRENSFRDRLHKAGRSDLANRVLNPWDLAA